MTFWDSFSRICKERSTTPTAVCNAIGLSNATATHWRQGTLPRADAIIAIADFFHCSTDYLLGRSDRVSSDPASESKERNKAPVPELSPLELRLIRAFRDMSEIEQGVLIGRAEQEADREREARKKEA